ncbi:MAG: hypothetical protein JXR10_12705, partial [Cyclobacteriaceae bacterium]
MEVTIKKATKKGYVFLGFLTLLTHAVVLAQTSDFSFRNADLPLDERVEILVSQMTTQEKIGQLVNNAPAI